MMVIVLLLLAFCCTLALSDKPPSAPPPVLAHGAESKAVNITVAPLTFLPSAEPKAVNITVAIPPVFPPGAEPKAVNITVPPGAEPKAVIIHATPLPEPKAECPGDLGACIDMCPASIFEQCVRSCEKRCSSSDIENTLRTTTLGGSSAQGGFSVGKPNPKKLIWDNPKSNPSFPPEIRTGWLNVPVLHDENIAHYEKPPHACLRVAMKPAAIQPARLGPILLHCGGPGSDASCASFFGTTFMELNSSYLVGAPLSEDYDYWSISQRGMKQFSSVSTCPFKDENDRQLQPWPNVECDSINDLIKKNGVKAVLELMDGDASVETWESTIKPAIDGPPTDLFGVPFYNETYVRWLYRTMKLQLNLCYQEDRYSIVSGTNRSYNMLNYGGTENLAYDIEIFRKAIGAKKMSIFGVSYGTMVGSVYATVFPDKVHRLIVDGDMGTDPDVSSFANWVGESTEATWTGLSEACDSSLMGGGPAQQRCPAAPGATGKLYNLFLNASTPKEQSNALTVFLAFKFGVYTAGAPCAHALMSCINDMHLGKAVNESSCVFIDGYPSGCTLLPGHAPLSSTWPPALVGGLEKVASVLGMDYAGRFTEQKFIEWWRKTKVEQPVGLTRSLQMAASVSVWPAMARPQPPVGDAIVAPLIIGNLHDPQTPYHNAQMMSRAFPAGRMLTWQGYGHGLQVPSNVSAVVQQYENEMRNSTLPTYSNDVAKLLCVKVALQYLKDGTLPRDYVCKAASPAMTAPSARTSAWQVVV